MGVWPSRSTWPRPPRAPPLPCWGRIILYSWLIRASWRGPIEAGGRGLDDPPWEDDDVTPDEDDVVAPVAGWEVVGVTCGGCGFGTGAGCWEENGEETD